MKKGLIAAFIFLIILIVVLKPSVFLGSSTIDIQLHDTYFVISFKEFTVLILLVLSFVFSLTACLATRFKTHHFTAILLVSIAGIIIISVIYRILFATTQDESQTQQSPGPDTASYLAQVRAFIQWYRASPQLPAELVLEDSAAVHPYDINFDDCLADTVDFTREEREQIRQAAANPPIQVWTADLVPAARIIASDSIKAVFNSKGIAGWNIFYKIYGPSTIGSVPQFSFAIIHYAFSIPTIAVAASAGMAPLHFIKKLAISGSACVILDPGSAEVILSFVLFSDMRKHDRRTLKECLDSIPIRRVSVKELSQRGRFEYYTHRHPRHGSTGIVLF